MKKTLKKMILCALLIAALTVPGTLGAAYEVIKSGTVPGSATGSVKSTVSAKDGALPGDDSAIREDIASAVSESVTTGNKQEKLVFLVTGVDDVGNNTDVIMLVALDKASGEVSIVQIPRDSYINSKKYGFHKLNAVYSFGYNRAVKKGFAPRDAVHAGNTELAEFLTAVTSVNIDYYFSLATDGFVNIIDSIGGVTVDVPADIDYDDEKQDLHIHFEAGVNNLDGKTAERFIRYRSGYLTADYGRMDAQKLLFCALFKKVKSDLTLPQLLKLAHSAYTEVTTDMPLRAMLSLVPTAFRTETDKIAMITLKGRGVVEKGVMYEIQNRKYALDVFNYYLLDRSIDLEDFDPDGLLNDTSNSEINAFYLDSAPFSLESYSAGDESRIKSSIPLR